MVKLAMQDGTVITLEAFIKQAINSQIEDLKRAYPQLTNDDVKLIMGRALTANLVREEIRNQIDFLMEQNWLSDFNNGKVW